MGQAILACSKAWGAHEQLAGSLCAQLAADLEAKAAGGTTAQDVQGAMSLMNCWAAIFRSSVHMLDAQAAGATPQPTAA